MKNKYNNNIELTTKGSFRAHFDNLLPKLKKMNEFLNENLSDSFKKMEFLVNYEFGNFSTIKKLNQNNVGNFGV